MRGPARAILLGLLPALLGWGLWRLERDRPLWRHPGFGASTPAVAPAPPLPRLVLAFHYPWYGTPWGPAGRFRHWDHARVATSSGRILGFHDPRREPTPGRRDLGAAHYPEGGPYDSLDPAVLRRQVEAARQAGLDGLVVSWWGRESPEARVFGPLLEAAAGAGLRLAPYYETGELWRRGGPGVAADLLALLDAHAGAPAWLRVGGAPVVFVYAAHRLPPAAWEYVRRRLHAASRRAFLVADAPSLRRLERPGWIQAFDALHAYNTPVDVLARGGDLAEAYRRRAALAAAAGRPFLPAVLPGYDDRAVRSPGTVVDRAGGATYETTWSAALATDPAWVLVVSWNEWHEGSEIEPSREHGGRYVEATRRRANAFRAGPTPDTAARGPGPAGSPPLPVRTGRTP